MAKRTSSNWLAILFLSAMAGNVAGCGHSKSSPASSAGAPPSSTLSALPRYDSGLDITSLPGNKVEVTYTDKTVVFDSATVRQVLRGASAKNGIFVLDGSSEQVRKLVPGSVMFLQGLTLRKVVAIAKDGPNIIVGTEEAAITDAVKNGQMQMDLPVNFLQLQSEKRQRAALLRFGDPAAYPPFPEFWARLNPVVHADEGAGAEESGASEDEDWKFGFKVKPTPGRLDFQVTGNKTFLESIDASMSATGHLSNFRTTMSLLVQDGAIRQYDFKESDLDGEVVFDWTVGRRPNTKPIAGEDDEKHIKLPVILKVPFTLGGFPFTLEVGGALLVKPGFSGASEIAKGSFKVTFSGAGGFQFGSGDQAAKDGDLSGDTTIQNSAAVSPLAGMAVLLAMALPRVELKTGVESALDVIEQTFPESLTKKAEEALENSGLGHWLKDKVKDKIKDKLLPEAAAYFQIVISSSAMTAGMASMIPCQRYILLMSGHVGADMKGLGMSKEFKAPQPLFEKKVVMNDPPSKACSK